MRYEITALFGRPVDGRIQRCCSERDLESSYGETPGSAALMFLHRLTDEEREATTRVLVCAPDVDQRVPYPIYRGPVIEFVRVGGRLELVEEE